MEVQEIIENMKELQSRILEFIDDETEDEANPFEDLKEYLDDFGIQEVQNDFIQFLQFLVKIANNHHRSPGFFNRIQQILLLYKDQIKQTLSKPRILKIFISNKPLFLFLIKEGIYEPDQNLFNYINNDKYKISKYLLYFYPELNSYYDAKTKEEIEEQYKELISYGSDVFNKQREEGENEYTICSMIRNDSIDDFITFVNETIVKLNSTIDPSVFESNNYIMTKSPSLIEYSSFFGSLQIVKFLSLSKVDMPPSLWIYSIHGKNPEMIHFLEESSVKPKSISFVECLNEAIKCHHNDIVEYIRNSKMNIKEDKKEVDLVGMENLNYFYLPNDFNNEKVFYNLCKYNYLQIVTLLLKTSNVDINSRIKIQFNFFNTVLRKSFVYNFNTNISNRVSICF